MPSVTFLHIGLPSARCAYFSVFRSILYKFLDVYVDHSIVFDVQIDLFIILSVRVDRSIVFGAQVDFSIVSGR